MIHWYGRCAMGLLSSLTLNCPFLTRVADWQVLWMTGEVATASRSQHWHMK